MRITSPPRPRSDNQIHFRVKIRISSSVESAICTISSLADIDLPEPDTPKRKAVAVEQQAAICHNHVLADGVLPIVQTVRLHDFLCAERNQHGGAFGGQRAQGLDFPQTVRQHRVQSVLLLPAQRGKLAQVLTRRGVERFGVAVELLLCCPPDAPASPARTSSAGRGWSDRQHLLGFLALEFHIVRNCRGKIVVGILAALPVGDIRFYP